VSTTKECRMTKAGWPLGKFNHRLGDVPNCAAQPLAKKLATRFNLTGIAYEPLGDYHTTLTVNATLGINRYGEIRAFVEGYKAALYS
jgi:hypothetical protein